MNGAIAEPSVRTISMPRITKASIIGPNHHFFRSFRKSHISSMEDNFDITTPQQLDALSIVIHFNCPRIFLAWIFISKTVETDYAIIDENHISWAFEVYNLILFFKTLAVGPVFVPLYPIALAIRVRTQIHESLAA